MLPYQRAINRIERRWRRAAILERLYDAGPAAVYGGLLHYASRRAKPDGQPWNAVGWTRNSFSEIFGNWPRPQDRIEPKPLPDFLIDHWAKICKLPPTKRGAA